MITWDDISRVQSEQLDRAMSNDPQMHRLTDYGVEESVQETMRRIETTIGQPYGAPWLSGLIIGLQLGREQASGEFVSAPRIHDREPTGSDDEFLAGMDEST